MGGGGGLDGGGGGVLGGGLSSRWGVRLGDHVGFGVGGGW